MLQKETPKAMSRQILPPPIASSLLLLILAMGPAGRHTEAAQVHLIAVGDTLDKEIGEEVGKDIEELRNVMLELGKKSMSENNIHLLTGVACKPEAIYQAVDRLRLQPDDTIVFYYTGHGAYDPTNGQHMEIPRLGKDRFVSRNVLRDKLKELVDARQIRLAVLMTDMCNLQKIIQERPWPDIPQAGARETLDDDPIFKALFLDSFGFVDVSSASKDEAAAMYHKYVTGNQVLADGSIYSTVFTDMLRFNQFERLSWNVFLKELVAPKVREEFRKVYPKGIDLPDGVKMQRTQTVAISSIAELQNGVADQHMPDEAGYPLRGRDALDAKRQSGLPLIPAIVKNGLYIDSIDVTVSTRLVPRNINGKILYGIRIFETRLNNPVIANWEPNDVIYSINGIEIRTIENFRRLVANLGQGAYGAWWKSSKNSLVLKEPIVFGQNNFRPAVAGAMNTKTAANGKPRLGVHPEVQVYTVQTETGPINGLRVASLVPGTPAADSLLKKGDIILEINDIPTPTLDAFYRAVADADDKIHIRRFNPENMKDEYLLPIRIRPR